MNPYTTMKEIGASLGLTSHQVGRCLKRLGLRTHDGRPSQEAFRRQLVERKFTPDESTYLWAWRTDVIAELLAEATDQAERESPRHQDH
jgi:hypothetical protein